MKTRLSPPLAADEAAALAAAFLRDITANIAAAARQAPIEAWVAYAPDGSADLFDGMLAPGTRLVLADGAIAPSHGVRGFGLCLLHAVQALLAAGAGAACLVNSDSPDLPTSLLVSAALRLGEPGDRVVLGPAEDGGYCLIGLKAPHARLFGDIDWSTPHVAEQTRQRAAELGLELVELPPWYDVDDEASLRRLLRRRTESALAPYPAPATSELADRLGLAARLRTPSSALP